MVRWQPSERTHRGREPNRGRIRLIELGVEPVLMDVSASSGIVAVDSETEVEDAGDADIVRRGRHFRLLVVGLHLLASSLALVRA